MSENEVHYLKNSEKVLLDLVKQKDQVAFRQIYEKYEKRTYALCLRLTGNIPMAEEATQDVFIQVWEKIDRFTGKSKFSTWLHSVARNTTISYMRKQKNWLKIIKSSDNDEKINNEDAYVGETDLSVLDRLILKLPERTRVVFVLHAIEGLRHEDIAKHLKIPIGTSKTHFHRAKTLMKAWLEDES